MADTEAKGPIEPINIGTENLRNSLIKDPIFFAEKILGNPVVSCSITLPVQMHTTQATQSVTTTIPFYMMNDFNLGTLSNKWSDLVDTGGMNVFADWLNGVQSMQGETQVSMQSQNMTAKVWKGSEFDGFNVDCLFVSTRRSINPIKIIRALSAAALPSHLAEGDTTTAQSFDWIRTAGSDFVNLVGGYVEKGLGAFGDSDNMKEAVNDTTKFISDNVKDVGMTAPLFYGLKPQNGKMVPLNNTTLTLCVGDWFEAKELLVQSISGITFSKEIIAPPDNQLKFNESNSVYNPTPKGDDHSYPLWAKCSIKLIPCTMMTKEKFQSYFKVHSLDSPLDRINKLISDKVGGIMHTVDTAKDILTLPK